MNRIKLREKISKRIIYSDNMRLSKRAIALFAFSVVIPLTVIVYLYSIHSANIIENELSNNMQLAVSQIKNNLDYRFEQISESALSILSTAYPYVRSGSTSVETQLKEYDELKSLVSAYEGKHMISKVRLYVPSGKIYANQQETFYSLPELTEQSSETYQRGVVWLKTYGSRIYEGRGLTNIISCRMTISSKTNYDEIASILQLDIEETKLSRIFSAGISIDEEIYLVDSDGVIISHPDSDMIGKNGLSTTELSTVLLNKTGHLSGSMSQDADLVAFSKLSATDWYLIMRLPSTAVYGSDVFSFDVMRALLIIAVVVVFVISLILIYSSIIENTIKRINKAIMVLNNEGIDQVDSAFSKNNNKSLALLENNANQLVVTIKRLMEESYEAKLKARDYQLKALQAQINPHFLYNTLDSIKWMILEDRKKDSIWMINAFSKYFRLSLSKGRDVVTLHDEVELIQAYIGIMQKRFSNISTIDINIEDNLKECLIPKLSLQPLVENALNHGILHKQADDGRLVITAKKENGKLEIIIKDNGQGMSLEQLERLLNQENSNTKGYGLGNVDERLKLFGGDDCGLTVSSELNIGTTVTLSLPLRYMEQE
ncbi:cache domain-containing sensor histidine kinase [Ruminiclostridium papyrosolvens]|uniref:histidine kinase n=1 Tax=Ruminiclostridium papyrosolvens C7 TaxID=1330534 RepID=U4R010_9FIRM|nr:sensor histidine kinase [Ruminiclostridium papyrosolvens]EPR10451.1 histidine kinase [Ruminiclostridium papyrosolvens C7]